MADIQFEEEQQYQQQGQAGEQKSFFVRLVLATGIVSTDKQAQYVLLGIAVFFVVLAFVIPSLMQSTPRITPEERQRALTAPGMNPPNAFQQ